MVKQCQRGVETMEMQIGMWTGCKAGYIDHEQDVQRGSDTVNIL